MPREGASFAIDGAFLAVSSGATDQDPRSGFSRSLILGFMCFTQYGLSSSAAEEVEIGVHWMALKWQSWQDGVPGNAV